VNRYLIDDGVLIRLQVRTTSEVERILSTVRCLSNVEAISQMTCLAGGTGSADAAEMGWDGLCRHTFPEHAVIRRDFPDDIRLRSQD
jgi:hypothetical protein